MAKHKGQDALARLARMQTTARPASEYSKSPLLDQPLLSVDPQTHPLPTAPGDQTAGAVMDLGTQDVIREETVSVPLHVTKHMTSHGAEESGQRKDARLRGRWTRKQLQYLKSLARAKRTTAGELIRHMVTWYLATSDDHHIASIQPATLDGLPLPREVGLTIMDFLTTSTQEREIAEAAGRQGMGLAAFLRFIIDRYQESGPLSGKVRA